MINNKITYEDIAQLFKELDLNSEYNNITDLNISYDQVTNRNFEVKDYTTSTIFTEPYDTRLKLLEDN